jgi:hypothetical protein
MTTQLPAAPGVSVATSAELEAARLVLARMGLSAQDLLATPTARLPVPTFAEYIPIVSAAVTEGTRRVYRSYWNRIQQHRHLDEPTPSQIKQLVEHVKVTVVAGATPAADAAQVSTSSPRCAACITTPKPTDWSTPLITRPARSPNPCRTLLPNSATR